LPPEKPTMLAREMALTFYYGSGSPYSWRVFFALEHKGVPHEPNVLSFSQREHLSPEFLAINPRHQVPAIVDDGFALYESNAILEYLEERFPGPKLFPGDLRARATTRRLIAEIDNHLLGYGDVFRDQLFFKSDPATVDSEALAGARRGVLEEWARFAGELRGDFLRGELSAADFALYPALAMAARYDKKRPELKLVDSIPTGLKAWMGRIEALPYFDKTYPPHWR
jgi:glutathione S-transferase